MADNEILQLILSELRDIKQGQVKLEQSQVKLEQSVDLIQREIVSIKHEIGDISAAVLDISHKLDVVGDKTFAHERKFAALKAAL